VHQLKLYKISLYVRGKDVTIKDSKLEILIWFYFTHHQILNSFTSNTPYLSPFLYWIKIFLQCWKRQEEGYQCSLSFRSRGTMCEDATSNEFLSVWSPTHIKNYGLHMAISTIFLSTLGQIFQLFWSRRAKVWPQNKTSVPRLTAIWRAGHLSATRSYIMKRSSGGISLPYCPLTVWIAKYSIYV
jgi:hypothetical protein